jgi:Flp pilus assembly protein CpaB
MKASTLFIITVAVLLGVTAVVGAKYLGLFEPREVTPEKPPEMPQVLVAGENLFEGVTASPDQVKVRPLYPHELEHYKKNREKYLPPLKEAAQLRVMARSVEADQPLLREYFQDQAIPASISERLGPYMRAVNVAVDKNRSAGGILRVGEYVDVHLTSNICEAPNCEQTITQTAVIARGLKIIAKRNTLWTVLAADPGDTVSFTLEANPYRAALIEFAKRKGDLALVPTPMDQVKPAAKGSPAKGGLPSFADATSEEYRDEDGRVAGILQGGLTVGDADLERIFKLKPIQRVAEAPPIRVVRYSGLQLQGTTVFNPDGSTPAAMQAGAASSLHSQGGGMGYIFKPVEAGKKDSGAEARQRAVDVSGRTARGSGR